MMGFSSVGGMEFVDFAKGKSCGCDLYDSIIAPYYRSNMTVETWGVSFFGWFFFFVLGYVFFL